jgi:hypothetical protein
MRKNYILLGASFILSGLTFGQLEMNSSLAAKTKSEPAQGSYQFTMKTPGTVIGQVYDFSNPSNWTIDNSGVTGTGWVITDQGPAGGFSAGMGSIESTSGGDFALFDADGNSGVGYIQLTDPLDFSTESNVAVEFESYYRNFQGSAFFEISVDNGTTWQAFEVHASLPLNESTSNPEIISVNISNVAANQGSVLFRFRYDSADDYAWMVDDLAFVIGYDDNLSLDRVHLSAGAEMLDYYQVPEDQLQGFTFGANVDNLGLLDQNNTVMNVIVNDGSNDIYDENSSSITINAFSSDTLSVETPFSAPGVGSYTVTYNVSSDATDQAPASNVRALEPITVGGDVYARDNGVAQGSVGFLGASPIASKMGQYFEFVSNFNISNVEIGVSATSEPGELIYAEIRVLNSDGTEFVFAVESDSYTLQPGDEGTIVSLPIPGGYEVQAGAIVEVLAGHFGSEDVRFLTAQRGVGAVVYDDQGQRFAQNSLFMVRPVKGNVSTEEVAIKMSGVSLYPNPVEDNFTLRYKLNNTSDVNIQITDVSGKLINTFSFNDVQKGENELNIEAANLNSGIYLLNIKSNGGSVTKRFVVK